MNAKLLVLALLSGGLAISDAPAVDVQLAQGGACTSSCRAQYNQCRIATKGSPSCDAQFAACMRRCIATRGR
ncbi:MAG: hypothetical protein DIU63_02110 [Proteobacteria bacterium]|nr:MAG: hypothetical protein DIU63_02110 [Pseudomonadota bacterium]